MPNTYAGKLVSNPNVPIFLPRVCTLVLFILVFNAVVHHFCYAHIRLHEHTLYMPMNMPMSTFYNVLSLIL